MRCRSFVALAVAALVAVPVHAQAPAAPASAAPAVSVTDRPEEPSLEERRIVAWVSSGVAVASLATGITMGLLANAQYACAADIQACNAGLQNKVVGEEMFDLRAEIEQKALFADMAFLFAGASAVVATVGFLRGYVFVDEAPGENASPVALSVPVSPSTPATVAAPATAIDTAATAVAALTVTE